MRNVVAREWSARIRSARSSSVRLGELAAERHQRRELVGLEDRRRVLLDERHAVEAEPGVDVLRRQRREPVHRVLVVLHEHEVPVLEEALGVVAGAVVLAAPLGTAVEVELAARPAGAGRAGLPEVVLAAEEDDPLARDADGAPRLDGLLVGAEVELVVAAEDRDPDLVLGEAEALGRQLERELDRALLEVVADREVAEHLEEGEVPRSVADVLDVGRAEALLTARQPVVGRLLDAREIGLERVHARGREQDRRVERRGDERGRRQAPVPARLEVRQEGLADLVGSHATIVAHPTTTSPRSKQATWPGATPCTGSPSATVPSARRQGTAGAW